MEILLYSLKFLIPSIIFFFTAFFILKAIMKFESSKRNINIKAESLKQTSPIRLQAYERLILLMERISLNSIIMRVNKPGMTAYQLQTELLSTLRNEYEHNLAQQLYVSEIAWELIKKAKEENVSIINKAATSISANTSSQELAQKILQLVLKENMTNSNAAIHQLKKEVKELF